MKPLAFAAIAACLLAAPAFAGTYTETIAFAGGPDGGGPTVYGAEFDPTLGTLTGVTLTASGSYTPEIFVGPPVSSTASVLNVDLLTYSPTLSLNHVTDGNYTLVQNGSYLMGTPERFSDTVTVTNSQALNDFWTGIVPNEVSGLTVVDVYSLPATQFAWGNMADDYLSHFSGNLSVTYTYTPVPEPAGAALLGMGAALLLWQRRRQAA